MKNFDYKNSRARQIYLSKRAFSASIFVALSFVSILLAVGSLYLFVLKNSGLAQIILSITLLFESIILAKRYYHPKLAKGDNIVDYFSLETIGYFEKLISQAKKEGVTELSNEYIFYNLGLSRIGGVILTRMGIPEREADSKGPRTSKVKFSDEFIQTISRVDLKNTIEIENIFEILYKSSDAIKELLKGQKIEEQDVKNLIDWIGNLRRLSKKHNFWLDEISTSGVGQDWSYGYTPILSNYSSDLSRYFQDPNLKINVFGHAQKLNDIQAVLAKAGKNNCLLVGQPGVGKKTIVNALASKLAKGDCLPVLKYKRIRQLDIGRLLAGAQSGELEARIQGVLSDAVGAGNIIIFIDNFQSLVGGAYQSREEVGGIDATGMILPFLQSSSLQIIAATSPDDYYSSIRSNAAIAGAFEKVDIEPATPEDTIKILLESLPYIENKYNTFVIYQSLKKIVELSERYIHDVPQPEKSLRLLEEVAVSSSKEKLSIIYPETIEELVSKKTKIPVGEATQTEKDKLLNLEDHLHQRVIDQEEAIMAVSNTLRRARAGISSSKRPVGVFLFLGPTGVGKTETAKALAENYFGNEKNMIRLDMSEYQEISAIDKLIGSNTNPTGVLTDAILANPFSLILLDEIEKANKNVLNLFLQVFEDGRLTDPRGRTSDFTNSIIIATSNAGSEFIRQNVTKITVEELKEQLINQLQEKGIFTPEFLNRFDGVIVFKPLTQEQLIQVANLMIADINKRLQDKNITVEVEPAALTKLVELGYDPQFGARPMRRVIQEKVENLLAKKMLEGTVGESQKILITLGEINAV